MDGTNGTSEVNGTADHDPLVAALAAPGPAVTSELPAASEPAASAPPLDLCTAGQGSGGGGQRPLTQPFCLLDHLRMEMMLHLFSCFLLPSEILRVGEASARERELVQQFPLSLSRFPLESKVRIKDTKAILHSFGLANRVGLTEAQAAELACREANVVGKHPTNGIGVCLHHSPCISVAAVPPTVQVTWLEPMALMHAGNPPQRDKMVDKRYFPGQKVRVNCPTSQWDGKVGTVELRHSLGPGLHAGIFIRFAGQAQELHPSDALEPVSSFFGQAQQQKSSAPSLSLQHYRIGDTVRVREKPLVLAGFDEANRDDYFEYMDEYCGMEAVVDRLHPTNGIRVTFRFLEAAAALWYEPPCLEMVKPEEVAERKQSSTRRLLVGQRVRLSHSESEYHGRVGLIQLHFHKRDYSKVTVRFPDGHEEYVTEDAVASVTSIY